MNLYSKKIERIKSRAGFTLPRDFVYNPFSFVVLALFLGAGMTLEWFFGPPLDLSVAGIIAASVLIGGVMIAILPTWAMVLFMDLAASAGAAVGAGTDELPMFLMGMALSGLTFSPSLQLIQHWDKVVVLRAGKFHKVHGPGIHFLLPLFDRAAAFIDTRIRVIDFRAEKTLTKDTVPVNVDALCFWMVWDAKQAVLEVENFIEAVTMSAQTALRDSIGKHNLTTLLSDRRTLGKEIQGILDAKTNPWGITILSVEFTDIIIPAELEDAMSKQAQAEREREARIILGSTEAEIAKDFERASLIYRNNETALNLRAMNMVYEGIRQKGSMVLLPASALDQMNLGATMGTLALEKAKELQHPEDNSAEEA